MAVERVVMDVGQKIRQAQDHFRMLRGLYMSVEQTLRQVRRNLRQVQ